MIKINKAYEKDSINIVFGTNNKYAKYLTVALQSLIENTSKTRLYDIIILETDVTDDSKKIIESLVDNYENISIRFVNTNSIYEELNQEKLFCHIYFSKEMYLRLFIPEVLADYDKAIYLDCDTIVQKDIADLYDIDLESNYVAAVKDYNTIVNLKHHEKVNYYYNQVLKLHNMENYFNSGVLLMNLPELRRIDLIKQTLSLLDIHQELLYPDQDLLNIICLNKVKIISNGWNFVTSINAVLVQDNYFIPLAIEWSKGLENQRIIHFISEHKPWNTPEMAYADVWWAVAKRTPIYQTLLKEYFDAHPEHLKNYQHQ